MTVPPSKRMHDEQLPIDVDIVRRLVDDQFPQWRDLPVHHVAAGGTVNAIFRIGADLAARFPLVLTDPSELNDRLRAEAAAMNEFAAASPFPTPEHVALGAPGDGYPLPWSVQTWIRGTVATHDGLGRSIPFARDLVRLIRSLRAVSTEGRAFSGVGRGGDLRNSDEWMELCFLNSTDLLPIDALRQLWARFREVPGPAPEAMTHGDLTPGNLLVQGEKLVGVLDGGGFSAADPALDLVSAWHLLDAEARDVVRRGVGADVVEWHRGAAWAFQQAMGLVWYYRDSNPAMSALGRSTLARILVDREVGEHPAAESRRTP
jgi:aminoglycoside phosphotransferase (APT) family kinase protein